MRYLLLCLLVVSCGEVDKPVFGQNPCEELKALVKKKIQDRGVKKFRLDIVDSNADAKGRVVGTCDNGTKKIMYRRGNDKG